MNASFFDVLENTTDHDLFAIGDCVDIDLDRFVEILIDEDRAIGMQADSVDHVLAKLSLVPDDLHGSTAKNIRRANQDGILELGRHLHGLFDNDDFRHRWLEGLGWEHRGQAFDREAAYDRLADHFETHLDLEAIERLVWPEGRP